MTSDHKNKIVDLMDFYRNWPTHKPLAVKLRDSAEIGAAEKETLYWLIELADRVGKSDIDPMK